MHSFAWWYVLHACATPKELSFTALLMTLSAHLQLALLLLQELEQALLVAARHAVLGATELLQHLQSKSVITHESAPSDAASHLQESCEPCNMLAAVPT